MSTGDRHLHLAAITSFSASPHTIGQWRLPRSYKGFDFRRLDYWEHLARTLERGRFDMLFFADAYSLHEAYGGTTDAAIRYAVQYPRMDPFTLVPALARATRHLGFGVTASTTFLPPYWVARHFASLDHVTEGRIGWNIVTSYSDAEARQFGLDSIPDHDTRYDRADEYVDLCRALWASWEPDALVFDQEAGIFADPAKVHRLDHDGQWFRCQGPLHVPPGPQGRPLLIQAGSSARGIEFCARHAEVHFALPGSVDDLDAVAAHRQALDEALVAAGRDPSEVKVLWGLTPILGRTDDEARAYQQEILDHATVEGALVQLSGHLNVDLSTWPLDRPLEELEASGVRGFVTSRFRPGETLRQLARRIGTGVGAHVVGSPATVADRLEALAEAGRGDGFMFVTTTLPGSVEDLVELLVPELQRRGRFRTAYEGTTLRDRFGVAGQH